MSDIIEEDDSKVRRKGRPKNEDATPLHIKTARCAALWLIAAGLSVFILMLAFWSGHNAGLVIDAAYARGETAAESMDTGKALHVYECTEQIRKDAPGGATADYTADEQMVVLARYDEVNEEADWKELYSYLEGLSARFVYTGEFSLVYIDDKELLYLVSPVHRTGYIASLDRISIAGPEHYDLTKPESRAEGTVVLVPLAAEPSEGGRLALACSYSYGGILAGELKHLLIPLILVVVCAVIMTLRLLWIVLNHRMTDTEE